MTPWTAARQALLSFTISRSLLKLRSIESVIPSNHVILCRPLLLLPSIFPSIRVFSNASALHIRWSKYWSFIFSISPSNEYSGLIPPFYKWGNWGTEDLGILVKSHSQWEAEIYFEVVFFFFSGWIWNATVCWIWSRNPGWVRTVFWIWLSLTVMFFMCRFILKK